MKNWLNNNNINKIIIHKREEQNNNLLIFVLNLQHLKDNFYYYTELTLWSFFVTYRI